MLDNKAYRNDKRNKKSNHPEMNPKDETKLPTTQNEAKVNKENDFSLPHLTVIGDPSTEKARHTEDSETSPVHFPVLHTESTEAPQKATRTNAPVTGILFLPSIL